MVLTSGPYPSYKVDKFIKCYDALLINMVERGGQRVTPRHKGKLRTSLFHREGIIPGRATSFLQQGDRTGHRVFGSRVPKEGAYRASQGRDKRKSRHRVWAWPEDWYEHRVLTQKIRKRIESGVGTEIIPKKRRGQACRFHFKLH